MAQDYEMEVYGGDLYVVLEDGFSGIYGALHKYDGTAFTQITLPGSLRMAAGYDMRVYGNDLYVVLEDGLSGIYGALHKYDGTTFTQITLPGSLRMAQDYDIEIFDNNLMLVLEDGLSGIYGALYEFNGIAFTQIALPGSLRMAAGYDMEVYSNDLHLVLEDGLSGIYGALHKYDGTKFTQITLPGSLRMAQDDDIEIYGNKLMLVLEDGSSGIYGALYEFDGTTFTQLTFSGALRMADDHDMGVYNCKLYFVLEDGSSGIYGALYNYNGAYTCLNQVETACNSYTSPSGIVYTSSTIINEVICREIYTIDLVINNVSDVTTTTTGITISANNGSASFQWIDCDNSNSVIAGATSQTFTPSTNGNYSVQLTENGCVDTSACVAITTVGIIENSFGNSLLVYPNPTSGNFSVDLGATYENSDILIKDISGKLIVSKTISQSQVLILTIKEPAGIYIISVHAGDKKAVIRLIKQ
ncbi:MAG: T9SS type A sorting domain-containing protein [Bacteroidia bacterium]